MRILIVHFDLLQQWLVKFRIFEIPTPLSKSMFLEVVKTDASRQCVLAVALPLLGHHMVSPSLHHTNLFHLLVPAIKERLCSIKSDADPLDMAKDPYLKFSYLVTLTMSLIVSISAGKRRLVWQTRLQGEYMMQWLQHCFMTDICVTQHNLSQWSFIFTVGVESRCEGHSKAEKFEQILLCWSLHVTHRALHR